VKTGLLLVLVVLLIMDESVRWVDAPVYNIDSSSDGRWVVIDIIRRKPATEDDRW
jgi:hypothetical protein